MNNTMKERYTSCRETLGNMLGSLSLTKALLACGAVSSALYVGTDIVASLSYKGYSYTSQMVSELGAIGAPTRALWMAASMIYNPLVIAFGIGVWITAGAKRSLRVCGAALVGYGLVSAAGPFVPMHIRGTGTGLTDVLHIACTAGIVVFMLVFIGFGANASGKRFRWYSIATIAAIVIGGGLAAYAGGQMVAGAPTPGFGILERVNIYGEMLWILVLAVTLLRRPDRTSGLQSPRRRPLSRRAGEPAEASITLARRAEWAAPGAAGRLLL